LIPNTALLATKRLGKLCGADAWERSYRICSVTLQGDAALLKVGVDCKQVRQRETETTKFPNYEHLTGPNIARARLQAGVIVAPA